ncbi:MbnP family protein [Wenyingzhuangia sp. IMCC45533]
MKNLKIWALVALTTIGLTSCNNNDDSIDDQTSLTGNELNGNGIIPAVGEKIDAYIQFESVFNGSSFSLNKDLQSANNGVLKVSTFKYIVTDIVLHGTDGTTDYKPSTIESFHIVDQSCNQTDYKYLTKVPNGKYNKVSLRYGISEEVHELGAGAQGEMLLAAQEAGLFWGWTTGYRFMTYEGSFNGNAGTFRVHNGSHGSAASGHGHGALTSRVNHNGDPHDSEEEIKEKPTRIDNSKVITLDFSSEGVILVSDDTSPKIHLSIDVAKILDNSSDNDNDLYLSQNPNIIIDTHNSPKVAKNISQMFSVAHIHATDPVIRVPAINSCKDVNPNDEPLGGEGHDNSDGHHDDEKKEDGHDNSDGHHDGDKS